MRNGFRKLFIGLAFVVAAIAVSSCATRESAINDLQNFSYELRDNSQYYTAKKWRKAVNKWKKAVNKFGKIRKNISRFDYTAAERQRIGKLEGDCARYMVKGAKEGVVDKVLGAGGELQGILDALGIKM